jgi:hypothetical protein
MSVINLIIEICIQGSVPINMLVPEIPKIQIKKIKIINKTEVENLNFLMKFTIEKSLTNFSL